MVGPPPSAAARATPVVVVTNSRRSMLLRLVIEMASHGSQERCRVSGAGCQARIHLTPETWHLSERVQHAEGVLIGAGRTGVPPGDGPVVFQAERVATGAKPEQRVAHVTLLAGERGGGMGPGGPPPVRVGPTLEGPKTPGGGGVVAAPGPGPPAP